MVPNTRVVSGIFELRHRAHDQLVLRFRRSVLCGELRAALGFRSSSGGGTVATKNEVQWTNSVELAPDPSYYAAFSDYDFGVVFDDVTLAGVELWAVRLSIGDTAAGVGSWPLAQVAVVRLRDREAFVGEMDEHQDTRGAWGGGDEEDADGLQLRVVFAQLRRDQTHARVVGPGGHCIGDR